MFEATSLRTSALALARWTALLTGWVWLGAQGQRLGWSLASGLLAVALWWALRLVFERRAPWSSVPSRRLLLGSGLATALGAGWVAQAEVNGVSMVALLMVAALWALWSVALDARAMASGRCQRPWAGWPPLVAALLAWGSIDPYSWSRAGGVVVAGVLFLAVGLAWVSVASDQPVPRRQNTTGLAQTAMGLMMGSLWLSGGWCASIGWPIESVVGLHLALMAVLPAMVRLDLIPKQMPPWATRVLPLAMLVAGGSLLSFSLAPAYGLVGMLLLALAWALPRGSHMEPAGFGPAAWRWLPLAGPALLVAVGVWSPTQGPQAMALVYGAIAVMAFGVLLRSAMGLWARRAAFSLARRSSHEG